MDDGGRGERFSLASSIAMKEIEIGVPALIRCLCAAIDARSATITSTLKHGRGEHPMYETVPVGMLQAQQQRGASLRP